MLTIKDFKTNDPAVILTMNHGRNEDPAYGAWQRRDTFPARRYCR